MEKKEIIVVLILVVLVAMASTLRLFSAPVPSSGRRGRPTPLRAITPHPAAKGAAGTAASPAPLWPTLGEPLQPRDPSARRLLAAAETLASEALFDSAVAAYKRFIGRFPAGHAAEFALLRIGQCYTLGRRYREAAEYYESFLARHPDSGFRPLALLWSGDSLLRLGRSDLARRRLTELVARHPMSRFAEGAKSLLDVLDRTPPSPSKATPP
ncbi:MAG TPA: tetratricopeptide repeat protein [Planctomycetota bacterium]|nr:tetratricopeptide repeat protein [Planctomycetota bacterium]